jgi:tetratricopeptide (TPR) repeat protein
VSAVDIEQRAALEEQRDFLLRSLEDLEREHAAGDVDEHDYQALRDDYTARAAAVLRQIADGRHRPGASSRPTRSWRRAALVVGAVVAFAVLAGVLVGRAAGRREAGEVATGGISQSVIEKLNEAGRRAGEGDLDAAITLYDEVLDDDPGNAEALTYKGWLTTLGGDDAGGLEVLLDAATSNPSYPDVHAFLAIIFFRNGLVEQADRELDRLAALDPPPAIRELTQDLRAQVDAALAGG